MDTRLAPSTVNDDSPALSDVRDPGAFLALEQDEQAVPDHLLPADRLLRRLATLRPADPPADLAERTIARCRQLR